ncbi:MAG: M81 family metallopeptidase [Anaerolineae bacterium]|nr:M81 family metallopeptidase [Anaerolineae bacterium]
MRIALGGITHEANTFCPYVADMADFEARYLARGEAILDDWQSTRTEHAGALTVLAADPTCTIVPTLLARALSSAPIRGDTLRSLLGELLDRLRAALPLDGVLLVLHGAMMAEDEPDATGAILERVRALVGPAVPVVGTLDLHANVTARMVGAATALIGYHTAPHVDMFETGQRAAEILAATIARRIAPTTALERLPMLLPPENSTHNWGPLAQVIDRALELERSGAVLHAGVYPVQPWMDTEDVAASIVVIADRDPHAAQRHAHDLAAAFWARRHAFVTDLVPPDEAVRRALSRQAGTVILCDSADSTTSGSTGDSTAIFSALLRAAPFREPALANVVDRRAVAQAIEAGVGAPVRVVVGGSVAPGYFRPVPFTGTVKTISDGTFTFRGPGMRGVPHHMGRTVVLVCNGIHLVVMERAVSQWDPQLYRSLGLDPADARVVQVKSPMAFRAAYDGIYDEVIVVAAPGAANPQLATLPWQRLPRPIYPLDPDLAWP